MSCVESSSFPPHNKPTAPFLSLEPDSRDRLLEDLGGDSTNGTWTTLLSSEGSRLAIGETATGLGVGGTFSIIDKSNPLSMSFSLSLARRFSCSSLSRRRRRLSAQHSAPKQQKQHRKARTPTIIQTHHGKPPPSIGTPPKLEVTLTVGDWDGLSVGALDGTFDGVLVGLLVGDLVGVNVGEVVG